MLTASPMQAEQRQNLSGLQIFDSALAHFEADRTALHEWQYYQTLTTHQLDANGKVVAKGTWRSIVRPGDPRPLEYVSKSVEGKISFFEAGGEEKAAAHERKESPTAGSNPTPAEKKKNETEWAVDVVKKYHLRDRYDWKRLPDGVAVGEDAYVIAFSPKPNQSTGTREERFFAHLAGRMWVSKQDFTILRAEGSLQSPAQLFWIIARVTAFRFNYKVEPLHGENRLLRSSHATATTVVSFPFYKVRQKHWQAVDRYEPRGPRAH